MSWWVWVAIALVVFGLLFTWGLARAAGLADEREGRK